MTRPARDGDRVKATELRIFTGGGSTPHDVLADGAHVLRLSVQRRWVYAKVLRPDGRFLTRRYRHDQWVAVRQP